MPAQEKIREIEAFVREIHPAVDFSNPVYSPESSLGLYSDSEGDLNPEEWALVPRACLNLIYSRLGDLNSVYEQQPALVEDIEVSTRRAIRYGVLPHTGTRGTVGAPIIARSLALEARRLLLMEGTREVRNREATADFLFDIAQEASQLSRRTAPRGQVST